MIKIEASFLSKTMPKRSYPFGTTQNSQRKFFLADREYLTTVYGKRVIFKLKKIIY